MSYGVMSLPAANVMRTRRVRLIALSVTCGDTSPGGRGYAGDGLAEESWGVRELGSYEFACGKRYENPAGSFDGPLRHLR